MKNNRGSIFILVNLVLLCGVVFSQQAPGDPRQQAFEIVWSRVRENHFDPKLNGVDWDAIRLQYAPRIIAAKNDSEFYRLLNEMLGELKQSHFVVFPPSAYAGEETEGGKSTRAEVGMEVQVIEDRPTITRVEPSSPAAEAGLHPGFIVTHIGGELLDELRQKISIRRERPVKENSLLLRAVRSRLRGEAGSTLSVGYLDQKNAQHETVLKRRSPTGERVKLGELPVYYVRIESCRLPEGIGYLRINLFMLPLLDQIRESVKSFQDAPGIILDLRGNSGGDIGVITAVARLFYTTKATLGTTRLRHGEHHRVVFPSPEAYTGILVILVDEGTFSAAETFAVAMQENGRAKIVGRPTVGGALPSVFEKLPTGARLQYAIGEYRTPKGIVLEGRGILPDVPVEISRRDLLAGHDPILEKAASIVLEQQRQMKSSR
ncbi:MAG: S41 family peptidase [Acidobacteria bacterium]|nr:S41 family peptidase [Acidobacteriota bacterium]